MSTTLENYCEQIEVLILQGQAGLSGLSIVRYDEDTSAANDKIVVRADPRQIELHGKDKLSVLFWRIPVTITIHLVTRSAANMDTYAQLVDAANNSAAPSAATTLASAQFPNGLLLEPTDEGVWENEENRRVRAKTYNFIAKA